MLTSMVFPVWLGMATLSKNQVIVPLSVMLKVVDWPSQTSLSLPKLGCGDGLTAMLISSVTWQAAELPALTEYRPAVSSVKIICGPD